MTNTRVSKSSQEQQQNELLIKTLEKFKYFFKPVFLIALKAADGKKLEPEESQQLESYNDTKELVNRFKGLIKRFGYRFNDALKAINENYAVDTNARPEESNGNSQNKQQNIDSSQRKKVPKGYALWDLKQLKLHESRIKNNIPIWVSFWNLKGESGVGEFITNERKKIVYFKPYDFNKCSPFPLIVDDGRVATREGKGYYFKVVENPE
ncbi:MAG: hypothetical protein HOD92_23540 [Deltaproteobacteria bacterium]|jgi:hypothetical protein|nr:hypothetical protein [Deltaproteobacteria bacterium]